MLVASNKGECRAPAFVIAYLMYSKRMTLPNALAFVKLKRKQSNPNSAYLRQLEAFGESLKVGKELGAATTSKVTAYMSHNHDHRKPYTVFRGLKPNPSIVQITETVGGKLGIPMKDTDATDILTPATLSFNPLMKANILGTKTSIKSINQEDLGQLAIRNRKETGFKKEKLAAILSNEIASACMGTQQLQVKNTINKVELKR